MVYMLWLVTSENTGERARGAREKEGAVGGDWWMADF